MQNKFVKSENTGSNEEFLSIVNRFYDRLFYQHDYASVAHATVESLMQFSNSPAIALFEFDNRTKEVSYIHGEGFNEETIEATKNITLTNSLTGKALQTKKIQFSKMNSADSILEASCSETLKAEEYLSVISLPLLYGTIPVGAANLIFRMELNEEDLDEELLVSVGNTIAMALQNAKHIQRIEKENELRKESEQKYRLIVENQKDYIIKIDTEGVFLYASPNFLEAFQVEEKEILGKKYLPEIHPDDYHSIEPLLINALKPPYNVQHEERMKTVDGWRWIVWTNKPIVNPDGSVNEIISVGRDITQSRSAEQELQESEERFTNLVNSMPELVAITGWDYNLFYANNMFRKQTSYSASRLASNKDLYDLINCNDSNGFRQFVNDFVQNDITISGTSDNAFVGEDGELKWYSTMITKISYHNNDALLFLMRDITERKKNEEVIRKLAIIAEETNNGVSITNEVGLIEWVNKSFENITGYALEEIRNTNVGNLLQGKETSAEAAEKIRKAAVDREYIKIEILNYRKNGEKFWNELAIQPIFDADQNEYKLVALINDVTERKDNEEAIRFSEEKFSKIFQNSPNGIVLVKLEDDKILDVNESFLNIAGLTKENVLGKSMKEIKLWESPEDIDVLIQRLLEGTAIRNYEMDFYRTSGERGTAHLSLEFITLQNETYLILSLRDITEAKLADRQLKKYQQKLKMLTAHLQNVREHERQDIARGIHDELGQVLTALKMNIKLMQRELGQSDSDVPRDHLLSELDLLTEMVDESVVSAKRIIRDLRPELLDKFGLIPSIDHHLGEFCRVAGLKYVFNHEEEELNLNNDIAIGIFRTIQEAVNNTCKHAEAENIVIDLEESENAIKLKITDDGKGFETEDLTKINSFGLFGMRERILNFEGEFNIKSEQGSGTAIEISIPRNQE